MKFYRFASKTLKCILKTFLFFKYKGEENIPKDGPFLLCSNHRSGFDPVLMAASCKRRLTFMAKEELFKVPLLGLLIRSLGAFPIRRGKGDAAAVIGTLKILKSGDATVIFPEGKRMKKGERIQVKSGIIRLAIQADAPIVPAYVTTRTIVYGEPIYYGEYADYIKEPEKMQMLSDELMDRIYALDEGSRAKPKQEVE